MNLNKSIIQVDLSKKASVLCEIGEMITSHCAGKQLEGAGEWGINRSLLKKTNCKYVVKNIL